MCGICGILNFRKQSIVSQETISKMNDSIAHRGPDDSGTHIDRFIGLGHRRLSIIDIQNGRQPMCNENGRIWITYNGEVYNHEELKKQLMKKDHKFNTNCDTEVIIHAYEEWGTECVLKFNGMFAFAIWDSNDETLFLARDRLGIKPLYYTISSGNFLFASEIKALLKHPSVKTEVQLSSIPEYLFSTSLFDNHTMFKDIYSLPAGHTAVFENGAIKISEYWDINLDDDKYTSLSIEQYKEQINDLLNDSVGMRLMSDVPYGSLLSGGLDSSLVSASAAKHAKQRLRTFSIEFTKNMGLGRDDDSDTKYARLMAEAFDTDHWDFIIEPNEYSGCHEKVTWHMEKPVELTTPSLFLLHKNLKKYITVVLSGEGSDELFGGYYFFLNKVKNNEIDEFPWAPYSGEVSMLLNDEIKRETCYQEKVKSSLQGLLNKTKTADLLNKVLYLFIKVYLLEMLERQDKTSMAWGIETRVPFLDHRLVELVANIPSKYKISGESEKHILKESFKDFIPSEIIDRKKKPFPFPIDPDSIIKQRNIANKLVQSGNSRIANYFDKKNTDDFFHKRNKFKNIESLAIFRTSFAMIAVEQWHKAFGV
ncbi:MAG: asparagine synthase (glutamine-hydrolyzing) [candidate division Zixibacteria bacterium]|nr:asparagine synthase (glutamine-hydrolyzing) [candidate division Zixibacteria bacterium]